MPPSADDKIIEDAVQDFSKGLHSDLPLRHFAEFHDQDELKKMVDLRKENVLVNVIKQVWSRDKEEMFSLMKKVNDRINKEVIGEWVTRNREHRVKSVSFLQKWVDMLCDNFHMALEYQFLLNPDMEIESLKNEVERRKQIVMSCFETIWKPGNSQIHEERKSKLEKQLQLLEEEVFEKCQRNLENKSVDEGRTLLGEVKTILLERSRQIKSYVIKHQEHVSTAILRGMVEEIREYLLNGKGSALKESHEEIHNNVMKIIEGEIKFLTEEPKEKMTADVVGFAERLDDKLRSCFVDNPTDKVQEMQQDGTRHDSNKELQQGMTMQEILNEFKEEQLDSMDLSEKEPDGLTHESNDKRNVDSSNSDVGRAAPRHSTEEKKIQQHPSRRLKRSVKNSDSTDPSMIIVTNDPVVSPTKKQRTGLDGVRKITRRSDGGIHRRSARLNKASLSNSKSAPTRFPKRDNLRTKKFLHDLDVNDKHGNNEDETPYPNCESEDTTQANSMINIDTDFEPPTPPPRSSKYAVPRTTRRACGRHGKPEPKAASVRPQLCSVSNKPNDSNLAKRRKTCRNAKKTVQDQECREMCPKNITILAEDCPKYSCDICKKVFKQKRTLKYHGEFCGAVKTKDFTCEECGKGFHQRPHLERHILQHTGEKPFRCPKCPKRFTQNGNLRGHLQCHAKKKRFACKSCNLTFVSPQSLHEHNLTHKGMLPFPCTYCKKRFVCMGKLKYHVINHADERPFECTQCGVFFAEFGVLRLHLEHTHSHPGEVARKLAYEASVAYLLKETKNESCRDIPFRGLNSAVVNHVIKKANLQLPNLPTNS